MYVRNVVAVSSCERCSDGMQLQRMSPLHPNAARRSIIPYLYQIPLMIFVELFFYSIRKIYVLNTSVLKRSS